MENDSFSKDVNIKTNKALAESKFFFVSIYILETKFIYVDQDQIISVFFSFLFFLGTIRAGGMVEQKMRSPKTPSKKKAPKF